VHVSLKGCLVHSHHGLATRATTIPTVARHASCGGQSPRNTLHSAALQNDEQGKRQEQGLVAATAKS